MIMKEIERKFRVKPYWKPQDEGTYIAQGYLSVVPERTVRVRLRGDKGYLTVKGKNVGISRAEYEYEIPSKDAAELLKLCIPPVIEKRRYLEQHGGFTWEIDRFAGVNEGLTVAEIELPAVDTVFARPDWLGEEVSGDPRYYNANLVEHPYTTWKTK